MSELPALITSLHNPLVKQIRQLHQTKGRREQGYLLLEGTHLVETALEQLGGLPLVCYTPAWQRKYPQLAQQIQTQSPRPVPVSSAVLAALATTVNPDGVVAVLKSQDLSLSPAPALSLGLVLENLQDPGNLGTILRTCAATGVAGVWFTPEGVDWENPKVLRASAGAWFQVPRQELVAPLTQIQQLKAQGLQAIATTPRASRTYWEADFQKPTLLLLGNEGQGLSSDLTAIADQQVSIPQLGGVESLNVAIAASLLLYEVQRQRRGIS